MKLSGTGFRRRVLLGFILTMGMGFGLVVQTPLKVMASGPVITSISPSTGSPAGGTSVTITGSGFGVGPGGVGSVFFGSVGENLPEWPTSDTQVTVEAPPGAIGTVDITVELNDIGQGGAVSPVTPADLFTYAVPPGQPWVTGVSPNTGPTSGGTTVTISGIGFTGATAVGPNNSGNGVQNANIVSITDTQIVVTTNSNRAGFDAPYDLEVTTPNGTSPASSTDVFTYTGGFPAPVITSVSPNSGGTAGGNQVTINGFFLGYPFGGVASSVSFGGVSATTTNFSGQQMTAVQVNSPPGTVGTVDVTVTTSAGGTSAITSADQFTYTNAPPPPPTPAITGISPNSGPTSGGTQVTITGVGFTGATAVMGDQIGNGIQNANIISVTDTQIVVTTNSNRPGAIDMTVTTPNGVIDTPSADMFTYVGPYPAPVITSVSPNSGPTAGGTQVLITGFFLGYPFGGISTAINFGANTAQLVNASGQQQSDLVVNSPSGVAGTVDITVTTGPGGTSATSPADQFTYMQPPIPVVTGISPTSGADTGGTSVTITGSLFTAASAVNFGSFPAKSFNVVNDNQITAVAPAEADGAVNVTVTNTYGPSTTSSADLFTYHVGVASTTKLNSINWSGGPVTGQQGTFTATVTGTSGTPAGTVVFEDVSGSPVIFGSATLSGTGVAVYTGPGFPQAGSSRKFEAVYLGNDPYAGSVSATLPVTVSKASSSTTLTSTPASPSVVSENVTLTATIAATSPGSGAPTGTVEFCDGGTGGATCTGGTLLGSGTISGTSPYVATLTTGALTQGSHNLLANYAGDVNYLTSKSASIPYTVNADPTPPSPPAGSLSSASSTSNQLNGNATAATGSASTAPGAITATGAGVGAVTVATYPANPVSQTPFNSPDYFDVNIGTGSSFTSLNISYCNNSGVASPMWWNPNTSMWQLIVGDPGPTINGNCISFTLDATTQPTLSQVTGTVFFAGQGVATTTTTLTASSNPAAVGQAVTFTATVSGATPTGMVTFTDGATVLGSTPLNGGSASITVSNLALGTHQIGASYGGDQGNLNSTAGPLAETIFVAPKAKVTGINPAVGPSAGGTSVTITGSGFTYATGVNFDSVAASSFTINSDNSITAVSPAHTAGNFHVSVTTSGGTSTKTSADLFNYRNYAVNLTVDPRIDLKDTGDTETFTVTATDSLGNPVSGVVIQFNITGANTALGAKTTGANGTANFSYVGKNEGVDSATAYADNNNSGTFISGDPSVSTTLMWYGLLAHGGEFVIGDQSAVVGNTVTYWGSNWYQANSLSGSAAPSTFEGFANNANAGCNADGSPAGADNFTTDPGHSAAPPTSVPQYIIAIVTSNLTDDGDKVIGSRVHMVLVKTNPGYTQNGSNPATGVVEGFGC